MSVTSLVPCVVVLYFQLWGVHTLSPMPTCLTPCLCQRTPLINCSSSGLFKAPSHVPASATALDLSSNSLQSLFPLWSRRLRGLQHFWVGNNALESLSMCLGKGAESTKTPTGGKERCVSWAPDLQLLSADRNQLKQIPGGLCSVKALEVLHLSHNRISELGPADLGGCSHLKVVHLHHNLISTVHPQAFKDMSNLQVLDLSHNLLSAIPLPAYLSLRNLNALVDVSGNRWMCDCNLKTIRRWLSFDNEQKNAAWEVVCSSPAHHAGKSLIDLDDSDLTCPTHAYNTPSVLKEVTVDEGTEVLLSCAMGNKDSSDFMWSRWWTPNGHVSEKKQVLLISNITEQDAGLYVCVSGSQKKDVSIFHLHVRKRIHNTRLRREALNALDESAGEDSINMQRNVRATPQSDLVLAVCLSVFITFIVAFVLGVLLRPFLDKLWKRIRTKRDSTSQSSTNAMPSTTQQHPYVNEGYSDTDEMEEGRVGSRVRFGGVTEVKDSIPYYVTVENAKLDSSSENSIDVDASYDDTQGSESLTNNDETHCVELEDLRFKERSFPSSSLQVSKAVPLREANTKASDPISACEYPSADSTKDMELEPIPDPEDTTELEERSISPVFSNSGLPQGLESTEQSVDFHVVTIHKDIDPEAPALGFTTESFSEKEENVDDLDPDLWNDSGESFSFPDESPRSSSRVTQVAVLDFPLFEKEMSVDQQFDKHSSCSSVESALTEGEQTEYSVNPEDGEESEAYNDPHSEADNLTENQLFTPEEGALTDEPSTGARFRQDTITLDPSDVQMTFTRGDSFDDGPFTVHESSGSSNTFPIDEEEPRQYHVHPVYRTSQKTTGVLGIDRSGAYSSSDDEEQAEHAEYPRRLQIKEPEINKEYDIPAKNPNSILDINFDNSSSSTDIEEKTNSEGERKTFKRLGLSTLLFNRGKAETDKKAVQPPSETTNGDGGTIGGFLGSSINREIVALEDNVKPNTSEESFFETIGLSLNSLPKLKKSLLFSVSDPQSLIQHGSMEAGCDSNMSRLNSSSEESFFGKIDLTSEPVPRVKRYLQFSQSEPLLSVKSPSISLRTERVTQNGSGLTDDELSATSKGDGFFGQISPSINGVPKLKRYLQFTKSEPQPSARSLSTSLRTDRFVPISGPKTQPVRADSSAEDDLSPASEGDGFFVQIDTPLDGVPKVKRYLQFKQSEPQSSAEWPFTALEFIKSDSSSEKKHSSLSQGDSFFEQISTTLDGVPKVKRYIQFTQSEPQRSPHSPSTSVKTESVTPVVKTEIQSIRPDSSSENEHSLASKGDCFFEQISTTLDEVPKVTRYIQFTQSEPQQSPHSPSTSVKTESVTPVVKTEIQSIRPVSSSENEHSLASKGDSFFEQISTTLDEVPKVTRYIQFTQSEPQLSAHSPSTPVKTEGVTPVVKTEIQSRKSDSSSENEQSLASKGDSFFEQISTTLDELPKVTRYIQFTKYETPASDQSSSVSPKSENKLLSGKHDSVFEEELSANTKDENFFGQLGISLSRVPKVKRYVHFTESAQSPTPFNEERVAPKLLAEIQSGRLDPTSENKPDPTAKGDNFFEQVGSSFVEVPKVKRYLQFKVSEPQTSSSVTPKLVTNVPPGTSDLSEDELSSATKGGFFFGRISPSLDEVPKVKTYIQFTPYEHQLTHPKTQPEASDSSSKDKLSLATTRDDFFGRMGTSLSEVPKVKRYLHFTKFDPQLSSQTQSTQSSHAEIVTPVLVTKLQSDPSSEDMLSPTYEGDRFLERDNTSFDGVPKGKRYIEFVQHEPLSPSQCTPSVETGPILHASTDGVKTDAEKHSFFGQIDASSDGIPKVKKYIAFTQSEFQPLTKTESKRISSSHEEVQPINKDNVLGKIDTSLEIPKLKRYIQFTESEPHPSGFSSDNEAKPSSNQDHFFEGMYLPADNLPKVKRSLQFTQSEPTLDYQLRSPSFNKERVTAELETKGELTSSRSSEKVAKPNNQDNIFGQLGISLNGVPTVKRYIQFSQTEFNPPNPSSTVNSQRDKIPATSPAFGEDNFFANIDASVKKIPQLKQYLKFSDRNRSDQLLASNTERVTESGHVAEEEFSTATKADLPVLPIDTSLDRVPKIKRYIQFTQSEPHSSRFSSYDEAKPSSNQDNFFEGMYLPADNLPKVKTSLQFTQSEPTLANRLQSPSFNKVTAEFVTKGEISSSYSPQKGAKTTNQDNFFGQLEISPDGVPTVKKYIQFSQTEFNPPNPSSTVNSQRDKIPATSPALGEDNFFGQMEISPDGVPKVKRYIQFTPSEPQTLSPYHSSDKTTDTESNLSSSAYQKEKGGDKFFGQINASFDHLPKVKRYVDFTQAEPYPLEMTPVLTANVERRNRFSFDDKVQFTTKSEDFFGQMGAYLHLEGVPKVSRYIQFRSKPPSQTLISNISDERTDLRDSEVNATMDEGDDFFRHIGESFDTLQRSKRSLVFRTSDPQDENKLETLSSVQASSPMKVAPETSRLLSRPKRTLFFSKSDPYGQPESSTPESELISDERLSTLSASQTLGTESEDFVPMYTRSRFSTSEGVSESIADTDQLPKPRWSLSTGISNQDVNQTVKETPPNSPGHDEAREYLRDSSQARQRQERRRLLFQQKRRAMDGLSLTSPSLSSQESDNQGLSDHYEDSIPQYSTHALRSVSPMNTAGNRDVYTSGSESLTAKRISSLKYKSALHPGTYKYRSDI